MLVVFIKHPEQGTTWFEHPGHNSCVLGDYLRQEGYHVKFRIRSTMPERDTTQIQHADRVLRHIGDAK